MRRHFPYAVLAATLFVCVAFGQSVKLPELTIPTPMTPAPAPVTKLGANTLYVVEGSAMVLASPAELVDVVSLTAPVTVYGVYADAKVFGKAELRSYKSSVHLVTAAGTGRVELIVVPAGVTDPTKVVRRTIDVDSGAAPRPPPEPGPGPGPSPGPTPDPTRPFPQGGLRVLIVYETSQIISPQQIGVIYGKQVRDWLDANCVRGPREPERRIYDKDVDLSAVEPHWQAAMGRARTGTPWVIAGNGTQFIDQAIPASMTPEQFIELLKPLVKK